MTDNKRFRIVLAVMIGLAVVLLCTVFYLLGLAHGRKEAAVSTTISESEKRDRVVNKDNIDSISESNKEAVKRGPVSYEVIMNTEWIFSQDGRTASNVYVENNRENHNPVIFTLAFEDDPDNILYTSDVIPVGGSLKGIELDESIKKGKSRAVVTYRLLDDEGNPVGDVKAGVTLVFEE